MSSFAWMKFLESAPERYDRGMQLLSRGRIGDVYERIAALIQTRKVPQLVDVRDESTDQVRVVLELAAGADPEVALAYLYKHTGLESNFAVNLTALRTQPTRADLASFEQLARFMRMSI